MSETVTMQWTDARQARRIRIYDIDGNEVAFRQFMSDYHAAWDEHSLTHPLGRYFREQLRGRALDVRPVREGSDNVYEVRPAAARVSGGRRVPDTA